MEASTSLTSLTLLGRVCRADKDESAWEEFVQRYGPRIYQWCLDWNLQSADAEDITQSVMLKLAVSLNGFDYDPAMSFRGWLRRVTQNTLRDFSREKQRKPGRDGSGIDAVDDMLQNVTAREQLADRLNEIFDLELLDEAHARVRGRVSHSRWEAYRLSVFDGMRGIEIAQRLQLNVASVYTAKKEVRQMVRQELDRLGYD